MTSDRYTVNADGVIDIPSHRKSYSNEADVKDILLKYEDTAQIVNDENVETNETSSNMVDKQPYFSKLNSECETFAISLQPSSMMISEVANLVTRLRHYISLSKPLVKSKVVLYGSFVSGFATKDSDIDISIQHGSSKQRNKRNRSIQLINILDNMLSGAHFHSSLKKDTHVAMFRNIKTIKSAAIPILKFIDELSGKSCDVSFNNSMALHNTALLRVYCHFSSKVAHLGIIIKRFAQVRNISSAYSGTLSSYAWVIMTIFYLQQIKLLPCLQSSQLLNETKSEKNIVNNNDVTFCKSKKLLAKAFKQSSNHPLKLGALLLGFFEFYAGMTVSPWCRYKSADMTKVGHSSIKVSPDQLYRVREDVICIIFFSQCIRSGKGLRHKADVWKEEPPTWRISIADPCAPVSIIGSTRINRELRRAAIMLREGNSLSKVLQKKPDRLVNVCFHN